MEQYNKLFIAVPGVPMPQERPMVTRYGTFDRPRSKAAKKFIAGLAMVAMAEQHWRKTEAPVNVSLMFYGPHGGADIDNLIKLPLDAFKGLVWEDDKQVKEVWSRKFAKSKYLEPETLILITKEK